MDPQTFNCPMCGAATASNATHCQYCKSRLATVTCSSCFGTMFLGSKYCPRCGAPAGVRDEKASARKCPRCQTELRSVTIGTNNVNECANCLGLWLDVKDFEKLCADREQQAVVLGAASVAPSDVVRESKVSYVRCPQCSQMMNRINFARCSGVVIDVCRGHGTWFDRDELSRILQFIHGGGLEASRNREKLELEEERRRLWQEQSTLEGRRAMLFGADEDRRLGGIASAKDVLKFLLD